MLAILKSKIQLHVVHFSLRTNKIGLSLFSKNLLFAVSNIFFCSSISIFFLNNASFDFFFSPIFLFQQVVEQQLFYFSHSLFFLKFKYKKRKTLKSLKFCRNNTYSNQKKFKVFFGKTTTTKLTNKINNAS